MVRGEVIDFVRHIPMSHHMVLFYRTPQEKYDIIIPFIWAGLENHQSVIYMTGNESPEDILSMLSQVGVKEEKKGLQVIDGEKLYARAKTLKRNRVIHRWKRAAYGAISKGYRGLRVSGESPLSSLRITSWSLGWIMKGPPLKGLIFR